MRSIKEETLNHLILLNERALRYAVKSYLEHYHQERNHQGLGNQLIEPMATIPDVNLPVVRQDRMGGLLSFYHCKAAYNLKIFLSQGEEVLVNTRQADQMPEDRIRIGGEDRFVDHIVTLGKRQAIAGVERTLLGMKAGGYRKVKVSPHLAYHEQGIPGLIPAKAALVLEVWLREINNGNGPARC